MEREEGGLSEEGGWRGEWRGRMEGRVEREDEGALLPFICDVSTPFVAGVGSEQGGAASCNKSK